MIAEIVEYIWTQTEKGYGGYIGETTTHRVRAIIVERYEDGTVDLLTLEQKPSFIHKVEEVKHETAFRGWRSI